MKFGKAARPRRPTLAADLAELERTDPAVAMAAAELDRVTSEITGRHVRGVGAFTGGGSRVSLTDRPMWREKNRQDVARALEAKARREAEADKWIAEVRARKARR